MEPCGEISYPGLNSPYQDFVFLHNCDGNTQQVLQTMIDVEQNVYFKNIDYMKNNQKDGTKEGWRGQVAIWIFNVTDAFDMSRECAVLAMSCLDRFLQKESVDKRSFTLASICCLFLATKHLEDDHFPIRQAMALAAHIENFDNAQEWKEMEWRILQSIGWMLHPPTPFSFARNYLCLLVTNNNSDSDSDTTHSPLERRVLVRLLQQLRYLCEISACEYGFTQYPASCIAISAILVALGLAANADIPTEQRQEWKFLLEEQITGQMIRTLAHHDVASLSKCKEKLVSSICTLRDHGLLWVARSITPREYEARYQRLPLSPENIQHQIQSSILTETTKPSSHDVIPSSLKKGVVNDPLASPAISKTEFVVKSLPSEDGRAGSSICSSHTTPVVTPIRPTKRHKSMIQ